MCKPDHDNEHTSSNFFDDDFAEASIEAISLAALRTKPQCQPPSESGHLFPQQTMDEPITPNSTLRRLLSSLLPIQQHQATQPKALCAPLSSTFAPSSSPLTLPAARVHLVYPDPHHLWYLHVLSLPHNAIRAELIDLCAMLHSLAASPAPALHLLRDWFTHFRTFLTSYLDFEDAVLLPWIYTGVDDPRLLDFRRSMASDRVAISQLLDELANALSLISSRPIAQVLPLLVRAVRNLVAPILSYLEREQRVLPNLIQARHSRSDALNVERVMAKRLDLGLLLRWVPSLSQRLKLRLKLITLAEAPQLFCYCRSLTARHLSIVRTIVMAPLPT